MIFVFLNRERTKELGTCENVGENHNKAEECNDVTVGGILTVIICLIKSDKLTGKW